MKKLIVPESKAVKEVRTWRRKVQRRAETVGWRKFLEDANHNAGWLVGAGPRVVREKPSKKYGA
ncbi:MAG: hypothetical protein HY360_23705 [Verrucomicrobia bacterium]|nr:hypothetical protein [Verrucomicrobiota bacterium]